jgi:VIT1/CCC1 family predicted Fe2+/Mn2+ transporter
MFELIKARFNFALGSGVITILGLMVGLYAGTYLRLAVIGGVFTIAIADAFSDALGFHLSRKDEEFNNITATWISAISSFLFKFIFVSTFAIPVIFLPLNFAIMVSILWGFLVIFFISYGIAVDKNINPKKIIIEHFVIVFIVLILTYFAGRTIAEIFGNL